MQMVLEKIHIITIKQLERIRELNYNIVIQLIYFMSRFFIYTKDNLP